MWGQRVCDLWGQRVCDPSPFHVKAQGLRRRDAGSRTHHESRGRAPAQHAINAPKRKSDHNAETAQVKGCQYCNKAFCT